MDVFGPEPYFKVRISLKGAWAVSGKISSADEAKALAAATDGEAVISSVTQEEKKQNPPRLFDLTSLQRMANTLFASPPRRRWTSPRSCTKRG